MNDKDFLEHFGIAGMKWGKRRKITGTAGKLARGAAQGNALSKGVAGSKTHPDYSPKQQARDRALVGRIGVPFVNRFMNKGDSHAKAVTKTLGAQVALTVLASAGYMAVKTLSNPSVRNAGKRAAQDIFMKMSKKNIVTKSGEVILNPRNYKSTTMNTISGLLKSGR